MHWNDNFRIALRRSAGSTAHKVLDLSLAAITDETQKYARENTFCEHIVFHIKQSKYPQKLKNTNLPLCNKNISAVANDDTDNI